MSRDKKSVRFIAKSYRLDPEETLISLWYSPQGNRFKYLASPGNIVRSKDYIYVKNFAARRSLGLIKADSLESKSRPVKVVYKNHDFSKVGHKIDQITFLNVTEIKQIYDELVRDFAYHEDPIQPSGIKEESLLESALFHPQTGYEGSRKYCTVESAAAALMYGITHNHAFYNGNKRTAMVATLVFLDRHNVLITCNEDELFRVSMELADHKLVPPECLYPDAEIEELSHWIFSNSEFIQKGERAISQRKFKQILSHFGCEVLPDGRVERVVLKTDFFGVKRQKKLTTRRARFKPGTEGMQMNRRMIKSIREELELVPEFGIDSERFYEMYEVSASDFIHKYKKLLSRLSKV